VSENAGIETGFGDPVMMLVPLLSIAPIVYAARVFRRICLRLWHELRDWRARERDHFDFGLLNEYEIDRLAKDIGLSRSELLGEDLRFDKLQFLPHPNQYAAIVDLGGDNVSVIGEGPLRAVAPQACGLLSLDGPLPPPAL
jgi:uncharacterized protein YjiS (DUF1127 family)